MIDPLDMTISMPVGCASVGSDMVTVGRMSGRRDPEEMKTLPSTAPASGAVKLWPFRLVLVTGSARTSIAEPTPKLILPGVAITTEPPAPYPVAVIPSTLILAIDVKPAIKTDPPLPSLAGAEVELTLTLPWKSTPV